MSDGGRKYTIECDDQFMSNVTAVSSATGLAIGDVISHSVAITTYLVNKTLYGDEFQLALVRRDSYCTIDVPILKIAKARVSAGANL